MATKFSKPVAPVPGYRRVLPEGFVCPQPKHLRDDMLQAEPVAESDHLLRDHFAGLPHTLVDSGGFVFYDTRNMSRRRVRPDLYIVFGVDAGSVLGRQGYVIEEAGKAPDFALEVASPSTYQNDIRNKPALYARIGIGEYWRFDPSGGGYYGYALAGDILDGGVYRPVELAREADGTVWGYSPALDLCLCVKDRRLMYYDRKRGGYLHSIGEERAAHRETAVERDAAAAGWNAERAAHWETAVERDAERVAHRETAAGWNAERAAHQETAVERDAAQAEVERLREELRRLQGE